MKIWHCEIFAPINKIGLKQKTERNTVIHIEEDGINSFIIDFNGTYSSSAIVKEGVSKIYNKRGIWLKAVTYAGGKRIKTKYRKDVSPLNTARKFDEGFDGGELDPVCVGDCEDDWPEWPEEHPVNECESPDCDFDENDSSDDWEDENEPACKGCDDDTPSVRAQAFSAINIFYKTNNDSQFRDRMKKFVNDNECCLGTTVDPLLLVKVYNFYDEQKRLIQQQHPEWSNAEVLAEVWLNIAQLGLDVIGLIPGVGEIADAVNGTIYIYRGDAVNASFSFAAMVPFAGWGATIGKLAVKTVPNVITGSQKVLTITYDVVEKSYKFGTSSDLAKVITTNGTQEAHHIIPWAKNNSDVVQKAADAGFHINDPINGAALEKFSKITGDGLHGNHHAYNDFMEAKFDDFLAKTQNATGLEAKDFLENELIPNLRDLIDEAKNYTGGNLNDYFRDVINPANGIKK